MPANAGMALPGKGTPAGVPSVKIQAAYCFSGLGDQESDGMAVATWCVTEVGVSDCRHLQDSGWTVQACVPAGQGGRRSAGKRILWDGMTRNGFLWDRAGVARDVAGTVEPRF